MLRNDKSLNPIMTNFAIRSMLQAAFNVQNSFIRKWNVEIGKLIRFIALKKLQWLIYFALFSVK